MFVAFGLIISSDVYSFPPYGEAIRKYKGSFWWEPKLPLVEVDTGALENERNPAQHPRNERYLCEGFVCAEGNAKFLAVRRVLAVP